jgi:hypothetical protein
LNRCLYRPGYYLFRASELTLHPQGPGRKTEGGGGKAELAEDKLAKKNSEFITEKADLVEKRKKDNIILKDLQADVQTHQTYMHQAEQSRDLLNADIMGEVPDP